ncbi:MAG: hypothetical protein A2231_12865 [Candidatus Firestonebacteria bacterium RIFOXYA2_FULL_40_8]|nr:MAG: hypothetical protein A2231_12865 [Candidatus Firestonebacteria bacterium RIFOXYA2_FULL_40_8]
MKGLLKIFTKDILKLSLWFIAVSLMVFFAAKNNFFLSLGIMVCFSLVAGVYVFGTEKETNSLIFTESLPATKKQIWLAKTAVIITFTIILILLLNYIKPSYKNLYFKMPPYIENGVNIELKSEIIYIITSMLVFSSALSYCISTVMKRTLSCVLMSVLMWILAEWTFYTMCYYGSGVYEIFESANDIHFSVSLAFRRVYDAGNDANLLHLYQSFAKQYYEQMIIAIDLAKTYFVATMIFSNLVLSLLCYYLSFKFYTERRG